MDGVDSKPGGRFLLRRFEWSAPDRLLVAGALEGLAPPPETPALLLQGDERRHRLPGTLDADGAGEWTASFVWREPPVAFHQAELELGAGLAVALPQPGHVDGEPALEIRDERSAAPATAGQAPGGEAPADTPRAAPRPAPADGRGLGDALRSEAALVGAEEALRAEQGQRRQLEQELLRARADLKGERERHAVDIDRFREGLAHVQTVGEQALAVADAEIAALRERLEALEGQAAESEQLRGELEGSRREAEELRAALEDARAQVGQAGAQLEQVARELQQARVQVDEGAQARARLDAVRAALEDTT
jgi:hypothetical protein